MVKFFIFVKNFFLFVYYNKMSNVVSQSALTSFGANATVEPVTNLSSTCAPATPQTVFNTLAPYLYEYDECIRNVRDYKQLTRQFLESTGIITIGPFPAGVELVSVFVSGPNTFKCITDVMLMCSGLTKGCSSAEGTIVIDTSRTNEYTGGDIAPGFQKLYQVTYITNDITFQEPKTTTSTKFAESTVVVQSRDTLQSDGTCKSTHTTTSDQLFAPVYAINTKSISDDSGGTYGTPLTGSDAVNLAPTDTSNCIPGTALTACQDGYGGGSNSCA